MQALPPGWTPDLQRALDALDDPTLTAARVTRQDRALWRVHDGAREFPARLPARLASDPPVVGDFVALRGADDASIVAVLPRRTQLSRAAAGSDGRREQPIAANVDVALVVQSLDHDFNLRRLERYLVTVRAGGVAPVIVLNKADVADDAAARVAEAQRVAGGAPVLAISAATGAGVEQVRALVPPGATAVLVGSSGVGKSTLVNRLMGDDVMETRDVRAHDHGGRHTTTHRQLLTLPNGAILLDTPGMRELHLAATADDVDAAFDEIARLAATCRFRDCRHETEPGCAVRDAVGPERLASYRKLQREAARHEKTKAERRHELRQWGRMHRNVMEGKRRAREW